jgi:hypothetical protein
MNANQEKLNQINEYQGDNLWQDVIMGWSDYDPAATETADPICQNVIICFDDGSHLYWDGQEWQIAEGEYGIKQAASIMGRKGGSVSSPAKTAAAKINRSKGGGWPKGKPRKTDYHLCESQTTPDGNGAFCKICGDTTA